MAGWLGADTACLILGHLTDTPSHPSGPLGHPTDFSGCRLISRAASQATAAGPPPGLPIHPMRCCAEYSSHCSACRLQPGWRATRDSYRALAEMGGGRAIHMVRMLVPCRFAHWVLGVRGGGWIGVASWLHLAWSRSTLRSVVHTCAQVAVGALANSASVKVAVGIAPTQEHRPAPIHSVASSQAARSQGGGGG